jgi:hypothetical protein
MTPFTFTSSEKVTRTHDNGMSSSTVAKMVLPVLSALVALSPLSRVDGTPLTDAIGTRQTSVKSVGAPYRTDHHAGQGAALDASLLQLAAGPAESSDAASPPDAVLDLQSFALYVLSRGRGISESGQKAIADFRALLRNMKAEGLVVDVSDTRIGLEGETRICARFASPELAGKVWIQMSRSLVAAELVQLKAEKC